MSTLNAALNASASALNAERTRIEVAVSNLANAESTRAADGQPYRRRDVVLATDHSFEQALGEAGAVGVKVAAIVETARRFSAAMTRPIPMRMPRGLSPCPTSARRKRWST
jgi:flagellar basal body rod protein FlgC